MNQPKRHHVMPQCYLEGFTLPSSPAHLYAIDAKHGVDHTTNVSKLIVERDFYHIPNAKGDPYIAEKLLGNAEAAATPIIRRIEETLILPNGKDLHDLLFFVANLWARARHFRSTMDKFIGDVSKKLMWATLATREQWEMTVARMKADGIELPATDYEGMKAFVESGNYNINTDRGWLINMMLESTARVFDLLVQRSWILYASTSDNSGPAFVTCDEPVGLRWIKPMGGMRPPGFGLQNTVVTFPLTRRCYLEGYFPPDLKHQTTEVVRLDPTLIAWRNIRTIEIAGDIVLAPDRNFIWLDEAGQVKRAPDLLAHIHRRRAEKKSEML